MMKKIIILTATVLCSAVLAVAQNNSCTIRGTFTTDSLTRAKGRVEKVYLNLIDQNDRYVKVDSAVVHNKQFEFVRKVEGDIMVHTITGFDNGYIVVFVEPGEVTITGSAQYPNGCKVTGTRNNDLMAQLNAINEKWVNYQMQFLRDSQAKYGSEWFNTPQADIDREYVGGVAKSHHLIDCMRFLIEHNSDVIAPLMLRMQFLNTFTPRTIKTNFVNLVDPSVRNHPYYRRLVNEVLALNLKVGSDAPDIDLNNVSDGEVAKLSDLRGQYVLIDFWASWCAPCRAELPYLKQVYEKSQQKGNLTIVSVSVDEDRAAWQNAIKENEMGQKGWIHASDMLGIGSPSARMFGVQAIPHTVLIDPEGRVVAMNLRGEDMVIKIGDILDGNLYYMNKESSNDN